MNEEEKKLVINGEDATSKEVENPAINDSHVLYRRLVKALLNKDLDKIPELLSTYLDSIGKKKYEDLIRNLIRSDVTQCRVIFDASLKCLAKIQNNTFSFNINDYINSFYDSIYNLRYDLAEVNLNILRLAKNVGCPCIILDDLEWTLKIARKKLKDLKPKDNTVDQIVIHKTNTETPKEVKTTVDKVPKVKPERKETEDFDLKLINDSLEKVKKFGIVILSPMSKDRRKHIHNLVSTIDDMTSFDIEFNGEEKIVLQLHINKHVHLSKMFKKSREATEKGNYEEALNILWDVFALSNIRAFVFHIIGNIYLKLGRRRTAADYYEVAQALSEKECLTNSKYKAYDYREFVAKLRGETINSEEFEMLKPCFKMEIEEFENDLDNNYNIVHFNQFEYFLISGISIDDARKMLNLNDNETMIALLLVARNHYAYGEYDKGDYYAKIVERTKGKSKDVIHLLDEIRKNKLFYKNRLVRTKD